MTNRTVKVDLEMDPAKYVAGARVATGATRDLEKAARDLRKAHDDEANAAGVVKVAEAKLAEVNNNAKTSVSQRVAAQENLDRALRNHKAASDNATAATKKFEAAQKAASAETQRSTKQSDDAMSRMAKRTNAQFDAMTFTGLTVGLPAAAAVGAAGVTVALGVATAAFAGLGVAAAAQTPEVQHAFGQLAQTVMTDFGEMGQSVKGETVAAIDQAGQAWSRLEPQVQAAVAGSKGSITTLTGAVTDFAEGAMPGMITAVASSQPVLDGFRTFLGQAGAGLSDFFANSSKGAQGARDGFVIFGSAVQLTEGRLGTLFANLANGSAGPMRSLYVMVDETTGALNDLTAEGGGAIGFLQGFSTAGAGLMTTLHGIVGLVSLLPPQVSQFAGSFTAASLIAGKFGIDAGAGFEGLGKKVKAAGKDMEGTEKFTAKAGEAISGLAEGALNPAALAVTALTFGLDILGKSQEKAAQKAAEHAEAERDMAQAIREDGGILGAHADALTRQSLEAKDARQNLAVMGMTVDSVMDVIKGAPGAYDRYSSSMHGSVAAVMASAGASKELTEWVQKGADASIKSGMTFDTYGTTVGNLGDVYSRLSREWKSMPKAVYDQIDAITNANVAVHDEIETRKKQYETELKVRAAMSGLSADTLRQADASNQGAAAAANLSNAWQQLATAGGDVQAKGAAIVNLLDQMHGGLQTVEDAQQAWNDQMRDTAGQFKDLKFPDLKKGFIDAAGAIDTTTEAGSKLQNWVQQATTHMAAYAQSLTDTGVGADEVARRLQPMQDQLKAQLHAFGLTDQQIQQILQHYGAIPDEISTVVKVSKADVARNQIQEITTDLMKLPANKGVNVKVLSDEAKRALLDLGYQVVAMPDGSFQVFADTQPGKDGAAQLLNDLSHYKVTIPVGSNTDPAGQKVNEWKNSTDSTEGTTHTRTDIDPATGQVRLWQTTTDATGAKTTTYSNVDPATGQVRTWKQNADGTWALVHANADASPAERAILEVANKAYRATINVGVNYTEKINPKVGVGGGYGGRAMVADGGFVSRAPIRKFAGGGMVDIRGGGKLYGPGTGRSDSILTWTSSGPAAMSRGEYVEPENRVTPQTLPILEGIRNGTIKGYANGGMVQAEDGTWVPTSFYSGAPKGPHAMYTDSGFAKLRAEAISNGIWSLSDMDQNQLRTYGGWKDTAQQTPLQRAIQSGNASRSYGGGGSRGGSMVFNFPNYVGNRSELIAAVRSAVSNEGGNVQQVLGRRR